MNIKQAYTDVDTLSDEEYVALHNAQAGVKENWLFHSFNAARIYDEDAFKQHMVQQIRHYHKDKAGYKFLPHLKPDETKMAKNIATNGLLDTIIQNMVGEETAGADLEGRKIAVGVSNMVTAQTNAQLGQEIFRATPTDRFQDSNKAIYVLYVDRTSGNGQESTVQTSVSNTTTVFKVQTGDASLFNVGDRIRVTTTSAFNFRNIIAIDTDNDLITVDSPLADVPIAEDEVIQSWAEAGVFGNSTAGATRNTGTLFNRVNALDFVKDDSKIVLIEIQFVFTAL